MILRAFQANALVLPVPAFFVRSASIASRLTIVGSLAGVAAASPVLAQEPHPLAILEGMRDAYARVDDYTMTLLKTERIKEVRDGRARFRAHTEEAEVRFRKRPGSEPAGYARDIYFHRGCTFGCPAIYRDGFNGGRINVRRGPDVPPRDGLAMADQHHPITSLDLGHTIELVIGNVSRAFAEDRASLEYHGQESVDGRGAHQISVIIDGGTSTYEVRPGDDLWTVAEAAGQNMYVILAANESVRGPGDVRVGQQLTIPDYYAHRLQIWVDAADSLPLRLEVHDSDDNLYERYVYADLRVNVSLSDDDFR